MVCSAAGAAGDYWSSGFVPGSSGPALSSGPTRGRSSSDRSPVVSGRGWSKENGQKTGTVNVDVFKNGNFLVRSLRER